MKNGIRRRALMASAVMMMALSGCAQVMELPQRAGLNLDFMNSRRAAAADPSVADGVALDAELANGERSPIIDTLLSRRSVLQPGPMQNVASAVLAANSRAAEADLRAAMLRSEARELNWLPSLGPQISLTSLGSVVTSMVVDQVLFDNGGKRAEREFARADVEVAAVALAEDTNTRVYDALSLYLKAEGARGQAAVISTSLTRMERLHYVMSERVRAGVDDRTDLQYVEQRLNQLRSDLSTEQETANTAMAELNAMSAYPLNQVTGLTTLNQSDYVTEPLSVFRAEAEGRRDVAQARAERAGYLPSLSAGGTVGSDGTNMGLNLGIANGLGLGTGAGIRAIEAQEEAATARVNQQREDTAREIAGLQAQLDSYRRQVPETQSLFEQSRANYERYEEQLRAGQKTVPEVVGAFQTRIDAERRLVQLRHDAARIELKIAALHGLLVNGEEI